MFFFETNTRQQVCQFICSKHNLPRPLPEEQIFLGRLYKANGVLPSLSNQVIHHKRELKAFLHGEESLVIGFSYIVEPGIKTVTALKKIRMYSDEYFVTIDDSALLSNAFV